MEDIELHIFFMGMMNFFFSRRQLHFAAAIDDVGIISAQAELCSNRIHSHIAAADNGNISTTGEWCRLSIY
jgi:hypothetical protein